jgi:methylase of polypeptide subunit release factors
MKLSNQAVGALLMTLQKCLAEQTDITELLKDWNLEVDDNTSEIIVTNPPAFELNTNNTKPVFETE